MTNVIQQTNGVYKFNNIEDNTALLGRKKEKSLTFDEAIQNIENLFNADPFNNTVYKKLATMAKCYVLTQTNKPEATSFYHGKAMKMIMDNNLQSSDATGTIDAIITRLYH